MGLFDWLTGNHAASPGVAQRPVAELKQALLALNGDDKAWLIEDASGDTSGAAMAWLEQAGLTHRPDLVARWKFDDPRWQRQLADDAMSPGFRVLLRFDEASGTVRSVDHETSATVAVSLTGVAAQATGWRGQKVWTGGSMSFDKGPDGKWHRGASSKASTNDIAKPLRQVVADHGWSWHGVAFGVF